jgi:hypothetical protein
MNLGRLHEPVANSNNSNKETLMVNRLTGHDELKQHAEIDGKHLAHRYHELLSARIEQFKESIAPNEAGVMIAGFGPHGLTLYLTELKHADPSLITICGTTQEGEPVEVIQDVAHLNLVLMGLPPRQP